MSLFKTLVLFLGTFLLLNHVAKSETFIVSSNADSGTGTLREALINANSNGNLNPDIIEFNIAGSSLSDRTITISSKLPDLSSNLTIDGSTQPGAAFGISDAKVRLLLGFPTPGTWQVCLSATKQKSIAIYGLEFDAMPAMRNQLSASAALYFSSCKNIEIGKPGKGNVTGGFLNGVFFAHDYMLQSDLDLLLSENVKISANMIGFASDGTPLAEPSTLGINQVRNLTVGGTTAAEGNLISGRISVLEDFRQYPSSFRSGKFLIANNYIGMDKSGTQALPGIIAKGLQMITILGFHVDECLLVDNVLVGQISMKVSCFFEVKGNKIGTDKSGTKILGHWTSGLIIGDCYKGGVIGGPAPSDRNIFAGGYATTQILSSTTFGAIMNIRSPKVEVVNNVFKCNNGHVPFSLHIDDETKLFATVSERTASSVKGKAYPGARVDLYYSTECTYCEPQQLFASVITKASGDWEYVGPLQNAAVIVAATVDGATSEFSSMAFDYTPLDVKLKMFCNNVPGSITGIKFINALNYGWYTESGELVSKTIDLQNAQPGRYKFLIDNDHCTLSSEIFEIKDVTVKADISGIAINKANCGQLNGSITGIQANGTSFEWYDSQSFRRGTSLNLNNVEAGSYRLVVSYSNYCSATFGPFSIPVVNGLTIDESSVNIAAEDCNDSNGKITGIQVGNSNGSLSFTWRNGLQQIVGATKDLLGVPAGKYILEVKDGSSCSQIYSSEFTVNGSGISMNENTAVSTPSSCSVASGSIKGIEVAGATKFEWLKDNGSVFRVTSGPEIENLPGGVYRLRVTNTAGCSRESKPYQISQPASIPFPDYPSNIVHPCESRKGLIQVIFGTQRIPAAASWFDGSGNLMASGATLTDVPAGTYQLYLTDANGCINLYKSYTLNQVEPLKINTTNAVVKSDVCGMGIGSITGVLAYDGLGNYRYQWFDTDRKLLGETAELKNAKAGTYYLEVHDESSCSGAKATFVLQNQQDIIAAPSVNDVSVCAAGKANIRVNNPVPGRYKLYKAEQDEYPLIESNTASFVVDVSASVNYFISRAEGSCESTRVKVSVTVAEADLQIPNTFTPNGDGFNDTWEILSLVNYPECKISLFNRYGHLVFQSNGYSTPFDGNRNGKNLPLGVYYYIIELRKGCNLITGSLSLFR